MINGEQMVKVEKYRVLNTMGKEGQILFTGSSLMEQFPINELQMDFGIKEIIYNRGIGGFTTADMLPDCPFEQTVFYHRNNETVPVANEEVKKLAQRMGCYYIDVNQGLTDRRGMLKKEYTMDGIHMYANAYKIILDNMKKYL